MPIDGETDAASAARRPSSEWRFHRDIYRARGRCCRRDSHTHAPLRLARCLRAAFPSSILVAVAGGDEYAARSRTSGRRRSHKAVRAIEGRRAACREPDDRVGVSLEAAIALAVEGRDDARDDWPGARSSARPSCCRRRRGSRRRKFRTYGSGIMSPRNATEFRRTTARGVRTRILVQDHAPDAENTHANRCDCQNAQTDSSYSRRREPARLIHWRHREGRRSR